MSESESNRPPIGGITWTDLTVPDAGPIRDFYRDVVGWDSKGTDMGGYADFSMFKPGTEECVAGICHARGSNENLPAQWLMYITVENIEESAAKCEAGGGKVLVPIKTMGGDGRYCVIQDPAGAVAALFEHA